MEKKDLNDISYDYYTNTISYVKMILNNMNNIDNIEEIKYIIKAIYNFLLSDFNNEKIEEICTVSLLFESKLSKLPKNESKRIINYIYKNYIEKMIFDYYGRNEIFEEMNENIKSYVGYYGIFKQCIPINNFENNVDRKLLK